jgi:hypothetical protein
VTHHKRAYNKRMTYQYKPKHFATHELVPPRVFADRGDKALHLLNPLALEVIDQLRDELGPMFINTYNLSLNVRHSYGVRQWSGLRTPDSPFYRPYSQHTFGNAFDILFRDHSAAEVRHMIRFLQIKFPCNVVVENDTSWLHIAVANYGMKVTWVDG